MYLKVVPEPVYCILAQSNPSGSNTDIISTIDLPATFAAIANAKVPETAFGDSVNLRGALLGEADAIGRPHLVTQDNGQAGNFGFRVGKWKLMRSILNALQCRIAIEANKLPKFQLFDLEQDPEERHNVIDQHADVAETMRMQLEAIIKQSK